MSSHIILETDSDLYLGHLTSLETTLFAKDLQIKQAEDGSARLRREVSELKRRLSKYEASS